MFGFELTNNVQTRMSNFFKQVCSYVTERSLIRA